MLFDPLAPEHLRFCRPVLAETDHSDFPLQRPGSGFVVAYKGHYFLFSAKHVFSNMGADAKRVWIPQTLSDFRPWVVKEFTLPEARHPIGGSSLHADLALFWLDPTPGQNGTIGSRDFIGIDHALGIRPGLPLYESGRLLFASGFPDSFEATKTHSHIDYEEERIHTDLVPIEGEYAGPTADFGIHRFKSIHMRGSNPNGMSGGPVTTIDVSKIGSHQLVGMIIQGSEGHNELLFIEASLLADLILSIIPKLGRC